MKGIDPMFFIFILIVAVCYKQNKYEPYVILDNIWTPQEFTELQSLWQNLSPYQTFKEDSTSKVSHIGEAVPPNSDGTCPHSYFKLYQGLCMLPDRIDVAQHYFKSGGISRRKESFDDLVGRILAFNKILPPSNISSLNSLFSSPQYLNAVSKVCPGRPILDPIQLGIIILIPGQEIPVHYDVPWFKGATRYDLPQWLLVAMQHSGLFKSDLIPQIQGVAYLHSKNISGGDFVFWNSNLQYFKSIPAIPNTGIVLDGSLVAHGVNPFPNPNIPSLKMNPLHKYELHLENSTVFIVDTDMNQILDSTYSLSDLRISFVWRSRCFKNIQEKEDWHSAPKKDLNSILEVFSRKLHPKENVSSLDLAFSIINKYIKYPNSPHGIIS